MNCKPGDLAIIVRALHPDNVGTIVECVRLSRGINDGGYGPEWLCRGSVKPAVDVSGRLFFSAEACVPDAWLRPVSGIPDEHTADHATEAGDASKAWNYISPVSA